MQNLGQEYCPRGKESTQRRNSLRASHGLKKLYLYIYMSLSVNYLSANLSSPYLYLSSFIYLLVYLSLPLSDNLSVNLHIYISIFLHIYNLSRNMSIRIFCSNKFVIILKIFWKREKGIEGRKNVHYIPDFGLSLFSPRCQCVYTHQAGRKPAVQ